MSVDGTDSAQGSEPQGMSLTGRIEDHSFADIMRNLLRSRDTGLVSLFREKAAKAVHVQQGRIVFAQSSDPDDRLGECLLREGMISVEQYEQSGRLIRPGKRQGTILVELGYVTPTELVKGVKLQVEHVVTDLLSWRQGAYRIDMRELESRDILTLNISTENVLFQGVKRGSGWSQVVRGLGGTLDSVLERTSDFDAKLYKLDLTEDESHVVSLVNGRLSAAQICSMSYLSNHDTCLVLHGLACCGLIEPGRTRDPESLFREQVADMETEELRALIESFDRGLMALRPVLTAAVGDRAGELLEAAAATLLDEHWDVLRETRLTHGRLDARLVQENVAAVEPDRRRDVVVRALNALRGAICAAVGREEGAETSARVAAVLPVMSEQGSPR